MPEIYLLTKLNSYVRLLMKTSLQISCDIVLDESDLSKDVPILSLVPNPLLHRSGRQNRLQTKIF